MELSVVPLDINSCKPGANAPLAVCIIDRRKPGDIPYCGADSSIASSRIAADLMSGFVGCFFCGGAFFGAAPAACAAIDLATQYWPSRNPGIH
jgi:hypothetical protein